MDGSGIETMDSGAPQSYTWRDVRCSYEQRGGAGGRGSKPVEIEVRVVVFVLL